MKAVKHQLYRFMKNGIDIYEECFRLLCQIESILNSRPLIPMYHNPDDLMTLTSAHFSVGGPLNAYLQPLLEYVPESGSHFSRSSKTRDSSSGAAGSWSICLISSSETVGTLSSQLCGSTTWSRLPILPCCGLLPG